MERPLISFCLFAYNQERLIREAVEAAFAQTYSPLEIILSDDGSSDRTFEIMSEMAAAYSGPHKIILNRNESNLGIVSHVNKVFELSSGAIMVLAAGDDVSYPQRTMRHYQEYCTQGASLKLVGSYADVLDIYTGKTSAFLSEHVNSFNNGYSKNLKEYLKNGDFQIFGSVMSIRRELFEQFGPLNDMIGAEDNQLCIRALLVGDMCVIPESLMLYRYRGVLGKTKHETLFKLPSPFEYGVIQGGYVNALLAVVNFQWRNPNMDNLDLTKLKNRLIKEIKRVILFENVAKKSPNIGLYLYFQLWKYPKTAIKVSLYKIGLYKFSIGLYKKSIRYKFSDNT